MRTVCVAAEHRTGIDAFQARAFFGDNVIAAVSDAEIDATVRADNQTVHVVTAKGDTHTIAVMQRLRIIRNSVAVRVGKAPEIRNAGVVDASIEFQNSSTASLNEITEAVGEHRIAIIRAVAVRVLQHPQAVVFLRPLLHAIAHVPAKHRRTFFDRFQLQVVFQPVHVTAIVFDAQFLAKRLTHDHSPVIRDRERHRIGDHRLRSQQ